MNGYLKPARTKSLEKTSKLPPAISQLSRDRAEALRKAYERPKTAHRNVTASSGYGLPNFQNRRVGTSATQQRRVGTSMRRSQSESRSLVKIDYGRSPGRERIDDLRDELYQAKKKMASMETEKRKLQTQMHRVSRDSEKREKYLERLVTSKFLPAELNDTHMARTLASIKRNEITREQIIQMQAKELETLRKNITEQSTNKSKTVEDYESDTFYDSDYPEEPEQIKMNGILKGNKMEQKKSVSNKTETPTVSKEKSEKKEMREEKIKKKLLLAKAYAEQNAKLKERLKELKNSYNEIQQRNKNQLDEMTKNLTILQNEAVNEENKREIGKNQNRMIDERFEDLNQELREAYGEIDALRMENEHLHNIIADLQAHVDHLTLENQQKPVNIINIPRLDMTHIDSTDDQNAQTEIMTDASRMSLSNIDSKSLACAMAEIVGAHVERTRMLAKVDSFQN